MNDDGKKSGAWRARRVSGNTPFPAMLVALPIGLGEFALVCDMVRLSGEAEIWTRWLSTLVNALPVNNDDAGGQCSVP
jgi:uncharacterized membrane protein